MQALKKPVYVTVSIVCILVTQTGQHYSYQRADLLLNLLIEFPTPTFTTPIIKPNQQGWEQLGGTVEESRMAMQEMSKKKENNVFVRSLQNLI